MRSLRAQLRRVAPHLRIALIIGETGTCTHTVALALHRLSAESDATFITHTAASLLTALQEVPSRPRLPSIRNPSRVSTPRSTFFLPHVDDLDHTDQLRLLHSLRRVAALRANPDRPRIVFATSRDLRSLSAACQFDRALYRLISAVEILLPPLRSRPEDISLIASNLLTRAGSAGAFGFRALSTLQTHDWPGNIRELQNVVELARQHAEDCRVGAANDGSDLVIEAIQLSPLGAFSPAPGQPRIESPADRRADRMAERLDDVIQNHVRDVLLRCSDNKVRAAERLGISRSTLYRMLDASSPPAALDRVA